MNGVDAGSSLQPSSSQGTLQVILGSDYLQRQEETKHRWAVRLLLPIIVLWLASLILSLGVIAAEITRRMGLAEVRLPCWASGVALVMILSDYALLPLLERLLQERDQYHQGLRGEEATVKALQQHLDGGWTLFRNVVLPGDQSDIDGVLVGPTGVHVLEIKSYSGRFRNQGDEWLWRRYWPTSSVRASHPDYHIVIADRPGDGRCPLIPGMGLENLAPTHHECIPRAQRCFQLFVLSSAIARARRGRPIPGSMPQMQSFAKF